MEDTTLSRLRGWWGVVTLVVFFSLSGMLIPMSVSNFEGVSTVLAGLAVALSVVGLDDGSVLRLVEDSNGGHGRRTKGGVASTDERTGRFPGRRGLEAKWRITPRCGVFVVTVPKQSTREDACEDYRIRSTIDVAAVDRISQVAS